MRRYLATIHTRSDKHKKRFAFLASAVFTLAIFGVWSFVHFGSTALTTGGAVAEKKTETIEITRQDRVSPFSFVRGAVASSFAAIKLQFGDVKKGLEAVDVEGEYQEVRDEALRNYDR